MYRESLHLDTIRSGSNAKRNYRCNWTADCRRGGEFPFNAFPASPAGITLEPLPARPAYFMTRYFLLPFDQLLPEHFAAWELLLRAEPMFASPYFRPEYFSAMGKIGRKVEVVLAAEGDRLIAALPFERDYWNVGRPVGGTLCDFQGLLAPRGSLICWRSLLQAARLRGWEYSGYVPCAEMPQAIRLANARYLNLAGGYAAYCLRRKQAGSETIGKTARKAKRLDREHGLRFEPSAQEPHLFELLQDWKTRQYQQCGVPIDLKRLHIAELWRHLAAEASPKLQGQLSVLWAGENPAAVSYSIRSEQMAHVWFIGYNETFSNYSPGLILILKLAEQFAAEGITQLHLGPGEERFKTSLATDEVAIAEGTIGASRFSTFWLDACKNMRLGMKNSPLRSVIRWLRPVRQWWAHS